MKKFESIEKELKKNTTWGEIRRLFCDMLKEQIRLKHWLENLDKIDGQVEFNQWELRSILKDFLIDELKEEDSE